MTAPADFATLLSGISLNDAVTATLAVGSALGLLAASILAVRVLVRMISSR